MNENNPPPPIPPIVPPYTSAKSQTPLGDDPSDRASIPDVFAAIESLLRHPRRLIFRLRQPNATGLIVSMVFVTLVCSLIYGVVAGTFSGGAQLWTAPIKITVGLLLSAAICLPSLYIFTCLSGSQARLVEVVGLLAGLLTLMTILLIGFAPVAWIFSQSTESIAWMGALHLTLWFVATVFGARFLVAGFSHSIAKSDSGLKLWMVIFLVVAMQMTTALRPILGKADTFLPTEKKFFLNQWSDCLSPKTADAKPNSP